MSFEHFVETLDNVPPELQRNFNLIRDLDCRTEELMARVRQCQAEYKRSAKQSERAALRNETKELFDKIFSFADDKIELACLTYDLVDKNINRLTSLQPVGEGGQVEILMNRDMPEDPHEPKYCTCRAVSAGEMVACDNTECPIEWFHYGCVGLTEAPAEKKWYCPSCSVAMNLTSAAGPAAAGLTTVASSKTKLKSKAARSKKRKH